jgi:hypothetical protein
MRLSIAVVASLFVALPLAGQTLPGGSAAIFAPRLDSVRTVETRRSLPFRSPTVQKFSPIASVIIPGSGQYMLGNDRFIGYLAVEVLSWLQYAKNAREQTTQEAEFKSLARRVARAGFASGSPDDLPDADWAYYEHMREWDESGAYSLTVGSLTPETNVATFNGSRWQLAQATFSTREAALAEYTRTAVGPEFEWSWTNAKLQFDRYIRTTDKRNDAYRAGLANLMVIGANHALSMIDAFTTVRLRATSDRAGVTSIGAAIPW